MWAKLNPLPESINGWRWEAHRIKSKAATRTTSQGYSEASGHRDHPHGGVEASPNPDWEDCPGCPKCSSNDGLVLRKGSWRPTRSHEYVFLFSKSDTPYGDREAVREPLADSSIQRISQPTFDSQEGGEKDYGTTGINNNRSSRNALENLAAKYRSSGNVERKTADGTRSRTNDHLGSSIPWEGSEVGRNKRDVWWLATKPYKDAHFAVFPETLIETPILSSTSEKGNCATCGEPWVRVVRKGELEEHPERVGRSVRNVGNLPMGENAYSKDGGTLGLARKIETLEWRPTCSCDSNDPVPGIVLDPFSGSGTVGVVAIKHGRRAILIDLKPEYCTLARDRIAKSRM